MPTQSESEPSKVRNGAPSSSYSQFTAVDYRFKSFGDGDRPKQERASGDGEQAAMDIQQAGRQHESHIH